MTFGIMKKLMEDHNITGIEIRTAGVMTIPGLLPTQEVRQILEKDGIDISLHRSCQLTPELIKSAKLILGMTSFHVQMALRMAETARSKTFLLKEYVGFDAKNSQVQDPMGCTLEVYKKVYREIRSACKRLIKMEIFQKARESNAGEARPPRKQARPVPQPAKVVRKQARPVSPDEAEGKPKTRKPAAKKAASKKTSKKAVKKTTVKKTAKKTTKKSTVKKTTAKKKAASAKKTSSAKGRAKK